MELIKVILSDTLVNYFLPHCFNPAYMQYLMEFNSSPGDLMELSPLFSDDSRVAEAASIAQKLRKSLFFYLVMISPLCFSIKNVAY